MGTILVSKTAKRTRNKFCVPENVFYYIGGCHKQFTKRIKKGWGGDENKAFTIITYWSVKTILLKIMAIAN